MVKGYQQSIIVVFSSSMLILLFNSEMFSYLNEIRNTLTLLKQVGGGSEGFFSMTVFLSFFNGL